MADTLLRNLEPAWPRGEAPALVSDWATRVAELTTIDPEIGRATGAYGEAIAGATDAAALTVTASAAIGRERGALTLALAEVSKLPLEQKRVRGRALNL